MSFFDRQGIPESILRNHQSREINRNLSPENVEDSYCEEDEDSVSEPESDQCFEDDIIILSDYSLVLVGERSTVLTMH